MKRVLSHMLLVSFLCQIGNSMVFGNKIERIIKTVYAYYSADNDLSFFDRYFQDATCDADENEEALEKKCGTDLFYKTIASSFISAAFEEEKKSYLAFSELIPAGFYFSLIQPPD